MLSGNIPSKLSAERKLENLLKKTSLLKKKEFTTETMSFRNVLKKNLYKQNIYRKYNSVKNSKF